MLSDWSDKRIGSDDDGEELAVQPPRSVSVDDTVPVEDSDDSAGSVRETNVTVIAMQIIYWMMTLRRSKWSLTLQMRT